MPLTNFSSRALILAHLEEQAALTEDPETPEIFDNLPDDTILDVSPWAPASRPRFVRVMTAISERSKAMSRLMDQDFTEGRSFQLPYPWASPTVDQYICQLDTAGMPAAGIVEQLKVSFPELGCFSITPRVVEARILMLDQRTDIDYFSIEPAEADAEWELNVQEHVLSRKPIGSPSFRAKRLGLVSPESLIVQLDTDDTDMRPVGQALGHPEVEAVHAMSFTSEAPRRYGARRVVIGEGEDEETVLLFMPTTDKVGRS